MPPTPYERLGGPQKVRELVDRFYALMDSLPEAQAVRQLHPENLDHSREKLFLFLSGWLGGPSLYLERYGHPRLRARHLPFAIGIRERDQWLLCMYRAMAELGVEKALATQLQHSFFMTADHMRNRQEPDPPVLAEQ
jgi:hemoglobin